ncbi:signal peptidase II [Streptomyces sp. NA02950]|uniref:signal peptidase II n=1 Tax=Streptomyces sp. NA02950 TaxID=2742137 RepID=UPI00159272C4|nr:signal peptidase II [Streptomyces sp. NA02950]QKV94119.1 signal peptidase II [Streptomyces sp. NA02950]
MTLPRPSTGRILFPVTVLTVIVADQVTKALALAAWGGMPGPRTALGPFRALLVHNTGVAFGLGHGRPVLITLITLAGAAATLAAAGAGLRARSRGAALGLGLIAGGAIGNGADRALRPPGPLRGAVIDWITVAGRGPVFNLADVALVAGTLLTAVALLRGTVRERTAVRSAAGPDPDRIPGPAADQGRGPGLGPGPPPDPGAGVVSLRPCALRSAPRRPPRPAPSPAPGAPAPRRSPRTPGAARASLRPCPPPPGRPARG